MPKKSKQVGTKKKNPQVPRPEEDQGKDADMPYTQYPETR
ncbi:hypothetical protein AA0112_g11694 [Alternaria arborescens]|nr:hypothetical protein AA0112_g11694 [Alternaria arborescens]